MNRDAIARIEVGTSRGTGFLVGRDGLVLTALHVIADREASGEMLALYGQRIRLRFGDPRQNPAAALPASEAEVVDGCWSVADDWVLLRCTQPPGVAPLRLAAIAEGPELVDWSTFGFPDQDPDQGTAYNVGKATVRTRLLELSAADALAAPLKGISGAPCLVNGEVVGLLQAAYLDPTTASQGGRINALRIDSIVAACGKRLSWRDDRARLPFEDDLTGLIDKAWTDRTVLARAGQLLGEDLAQVGHAARPRRFARALLRAGVARGAEAISNALTTILPAHQSALAIEMLSMVACASLPAEAVAAFISGGLRQNNSLAAALACAIVQTSEFYARHLLYPDGNWARRFLSPVPTGTSAAALLDDIRREWGVKHRAEALAKLGLPVPDVAAAEVCVVLPQMLDEQVLEELARTLLKARLVVVTPQPVPVDQRARLPRVRFVTPELSKQQETEIWTQLVPFLS